MYSQGPIQNLSDCELEHERVIHFFLGWAKQGVEVSAEAVVLIEDACISLQTLSYFP